MYINCHSYYSLRYGTFSEIELLELAKANGIRHLALTDINNTSACMSFIKNAAKYEIQPVIGIDFRNGNDQCFVGIAKNNYGFRELNSFLSTHLENNIRIPESPQDFKDCFIIYPFEKVLQLELNNFKENEYIGISEKEIGKLKFSHLSEYKSKLVIQQQVTVRNKKDFNAHRLLRAIDNNMLLSKLPKTEECLPTDMMLSYSELCNAFNEFPHIISNTKKLLEQCSVQFEFDSNRQSQNLKLYSKSKEADYELLQKLCNEKLYYRYPEPSKKVLARLHKELKVITELDFVSFFLINYDIVQYAKQNGFFHVGRGSGANSIVAYIIGITDVDPIELDLYFERFINPYRASPPDFDIDFSWKDRQAVTQYIFDRFENTALLATYNTFQYRAVVRELGKVFGLPKEEIDKLTKDRRAPKEYDELAQLVLKYSKLIEGFPNYISVHSAGILILDKPVHNYSATSLPPKGFPTVQFDMNIAEDVGVFKFDILGQRGLAKIKDTLQLIKENQPNAPKIDITDIEKFKNDPKINGLLKSGKAIGAYYVESPAMRGLMQKLKTQDYLGLVAASSIIRPGVSGSGMKLEYIKRHRFPEKRKEANPMLLKIMPETYGIMVYQEDVLKVAHEFAGLTLGEADVLRRGMSGKYRSKEEFLAVEEKFISNCKVKGYTNKLIMEVWNQIKGFAGYAFAKGHSASYAVESYQSLFLKCYYPIEFMTAVLNNGGGFYSTSHYIHEAKMHGAKVCLPCINQSEHPNIVQGKNIYLSFGYLKSLEHLVIQRFLTERQLYGNYTSLDDFINRVVISIEQITILIRINAFRFTQKSKAELLWEAVFKIGKSKSITKQSKLFTINHKNYKLPKLQSSWLEDVYDEMELLGFTIKDYFNLISEPFNQSVKAKNMIDYSNKDVLIYGLLVTTRYNKTSQGKLMRLSTFIDKEGNYFDTVHFTEALHKFPINGIGVYACYGNITNKFGFCSMIVKKSKKMSVFSDPRLI